MSKYYTKEEVDKLLKISKDDNEILFRMQCFINDAHHLNMDATKGQIDRIRSMIEGIYNELDTALETPTGLNLSGTKPFGGRFKL